MFALHAMRYDLPCGNMESNTTQFKIMQAQLEKQHHLGLMKLNGTPLHFIFIISSNIAGGNEGKKSRKYFLR